MARWHVISDGKVVYSCAEKNWQKAENFSLDYTIDGVVVLADSSEDAIRAGQPTSSSFASLNLTVVQK